MQWLDFLVFREKRCVFSLGSGRSDRRFSTQQEGKLLYAVRTMCGHRFGGVPTILRGRDLFLFMLILG